MRKILLVLLLSVSFLFAVINVNTASKDELMTIKGIGEKKAEQIINFRKKNKAIKPEDLRSIKGFGSSIINNIKKDIKVKPKKMTTKNKNKEITK